MRKILFSILFLGLVSTAHALNYSEIRTLARAISRDPIPTSGNPRVSEIIVSSFVNIAQNETVMYTWCLEATTNIPIVSGQREYDYTSDMVAVNRVVLDGKQLKSTSISKKDIQDSSWQSNISTFTPVYYYTSPLNKISLESYPDTSTDKILSLTYIKQPITLTADSDIPFDGQTKLYPFHFLLALWTAAYICYVDNRPTEGDRYYQMYMTRVTNMSSTIRLSPDYYPSVGGSNNGK